MNGQANIVPGGPYPITWTWLRGLVYLIAQVDQICRGTGGPNGPGTSGGLGGLQLSGHWVIMPCDLVDLFHKLAR